ncbi:DUF1775 domain-containing protein [Winogradskya humida]|uniref:YncI copper-binding domain-containing protein n=1 Tax=Winogradskya humida TaxID=113566 RepID=A0ABQ3ZZX2_9ACTN|nr:DUF1775 domain-containing protein [Actinoplanes humidus]GIE24124.1 hypothetical protein Ahu01nite_072260 [Actinoplanes humidus]
MSRLEKHRRAGILAATVATGVLGFAAPAAAGVTVNPPSAPQGSGQDIAFKVTNTAQTPITKVKLVLPADLPVAEIYPLSVENWAPVIETKQLDTPVTSTDGSKITQMTASITWVAAAGKELAPGASTDLTTAMGPMPGTSSMAFKVEATYADPAKGVPLSPVSISLTPAVAGQEYGGHASHTGGGTADTDNTALDAYVQQALAESAGSDGPGFWTVAGWVVALLAAAAAAISIMRSRRQRPAASAEAGSAEPEKKELVTASSWRYQEPEEK